MRFKRKTGFIFVLCMLPLLLFSYVVSSEDRKTEIGHKIPPQLEESWKREIMTITLELKEAILKRDVQQLLKHIDREGMSCTDERVPYAEIKRDLNGKNSKLYLSLFETERFVKECGNEYDEEYPPISERELFMKAKDLQI